MLMSNSTGRFGGSMKLFLQTAAVAAFAAALAAPAAAQMMQRPDQAPPRTAQPAPAAAQPADPAGDGFEQMELTPKQVEAFIAAHNEIQPVASKVKPGSEPNPRIQAQLDGIAKKNGLKDFNEFDDVAGNVSFVFTGLDPKSKKFTEHDELLKQEIAAVTADKNIPQQQKRQILRDLRQAQKSVQKLKYSANVELVAKYYDQLKAVLEPPQQQPPRQQQQRQRGR